MAVTVNTVLRDIFSLWGIENPDASVLDSRNRALLDLNRAVQMIWQNPEKLGYFSQQTDQFTLTSGTASSTLTGIQNILGPIKRHTDKVPLRPITTESEFDQYALLYYGQTSLPDGPPEAYYLNEQTVDSEPDSVGAIVMVVPTPAVDTVIDVTWIPNAPAYTWTDYCADEGAGMPIPIPHGYGESLLLPIARKCAMSYYLFIKPERAPMIEADYILARQMLGLADPQVDETKADAQPIVEAPWNQRRQR